MTMISRLGFMPNRKGMMKSTPCRSTRDITIVIPVKDNQEGLDRFLDEFKNTHPQELYPFQIIVVDNNSHPAIVLRKQQYPMAVHLLTCKKPGPASARNLGVKHVQTDWILFTDSDCIPTATLLSGYIEQQNGSVAYAGNVNAYDTDFLSKYYEQQEILIPPKVNECNGEVSPDYIITANCLVWKPAFDEVGGFNESFHYAGGEDIDLGFKLRNIGQLSYAFGSLAKHNFGYGFTEFKARFTRYGLGNSMIAKLYGLDLKPKRFQPNQKTIMNYILAYFQYRYLKHGYNIDK